MGRLGAVLGRKDNLWGIPAYYKQYSSRNDVVYDGQVDISALLWQHRSSGTQVAES